jgi:hypothetical protein
MLYRTMRGLVWKVLAAFALTAVLLAPQAHASPTIGPGHELYFRSLVPEAVLSRCAWRLEAIQIEPHQVRYEFVDDSTQRKATIVLGPAQTCAHPARSNTTSFCVSIQPPEPESTCGPHELERGIRDTIASKSSSFRWQTEDRPRDATVEDLGVSRGAMAAVLWLWLAWTAVGGGMLVASRPKMDARRDLAVLAVTLLGLLLRWVATPFPANIRLGYGEPHGATAGREAFHLLLRAFGPLTLENVAAANAVVGALTIPAAAVLAHLLFRSNLTAVAGASVIAFHPILIRFSASDSAHVVVTLCTVLALVCTVAATTKDTLMRYAQAVGWVALAAATRHEAALFLVACVALAVTSREHLQRTNFRRLVPIALLAVVLLGHPVWQVARLAHTGVFHLRFWDNPFFFGGPSPWPNTVLVVLGAVALLRQTNEVPRARRLAAGLFLVLVTLTLPTFSIHEPLAQTCYRYFLPSMVVLAVVAGHGLQVLIVAARSLPGRWAKRFENPQRSSVLIASMAVVPGLLSVPWFGFLRTSWTHAQELAFVRNHLGKVDDGCTIVTRGRYVADAGMEMSPWLSTEAGRKHRWVETAHFLEEQEPEACTVYYASASCFARDRTTTAHSNMGPFDELPECRQMRERFVLESIVETELEARPFVYEQYLKDPVPIGLYRVRGRLSGGDARFERTR